MLVALCAVMVSLWLLGQLAWQNSASSALKSVTSKKALFGPRGEITSSCQLLALESVLKSRTFRVLENWKKTPSLRSWISVTTDRLPEIWPWLMSVAKCVGLAAQAGSTAQGAGYQKYVSPFQLWIFWKLLSRTLDCLLVCIFRVAWLVNDHIRVWTSNVFLYCHCLSLQMIHWIILWWLFLWFITFWFLYQITN